jgi:hypothetical protein
LKVPCSVDFDLEPTPVLDALHEGAVGVALVTPSNPLGTALSREFVWLVAPEADFWLYLLQEYFLQEVRVEKVGSSAMSDKVNPIDFVNAEGNLGLGSALLTLLSRKLAVVAEAVQTILRRTRSGDACEKLKRLTRGQRLDPRSSGGSWTLSTSTTKWGGASRALPPTTFVGPVF